MRIMACLAALMMLAACTPYPMGRVNDEDVQKATRRIKYTKDPHTGLCFGMVFVSQGLFDFGNMSITNVPCDKVEKYG